MSASTPNFSRPLPSPYAEMASPTRTPQTARPIVNGLSHSASRSLIELTNRRQTLGGNSLSSSQLSVNEFLKDTFRAQRQPIFAQESLPAEDENISDSSLFKRRSRHHDRRLSRASNTSNKSSTTNSHPSMERPIQHFRPMLWKHLDADRDKLNLDLFWPQKIEDLYDPDYDEETNIFPYNDLKPLYQFRNLQSLQLKGMMRSYQKMIWQCVWLNPDLQTLVLEMALAPEMEQGSMRICKEIKRGWKYLPENEGSSEYLGAHGEGVLHEEFGSGEYLDKQAITLAERDVFGTSGEITRYLPVTKLVLLGFAVDAGPFYRCFDPHKLRDVVFKECCFDVGFALPTDMRDRVKISFGGALDDPILLPPGATKLITLKKGKKVPEPTTTLKKKFSGIMRHWKSRED